MTSIRPTSRARGIVGIEKCRKCRRLVKSRTRIVMGYGALPADVMFVGLAPGRNGANLTGVPFTRDPSGILFQEAMIKAGFSLESNPRVSRPRLVNAYVTNLVKCNPKDRHGRNRPPAAEEIQKCTGYLMEEMRVVKPKVIVLLGKTASERLLNRTIRNFRNASGKMFRIDSVLYIPMIHPSYVIRGAFDKKRYFDKFRSIQRLLRAIS